MKSLAAATGRGQAAHPHPIDQALAMKIQEIKEMPVVELQVKGHELRLELFNLNLQKSMGTLEKSHRIGQIRKDIARVETMLTRIRNQPAQA